MDSQAGKKKKGAKGKGKKRKRGLEEEEVAEISGERVHRNVAQEKDKTKPVETAPQIPVLNQLHVRKSEIYTMPILDMNEARVAANIEIIKAVMKEAGIGLDEGLEDKLVMFKGDWLTARNITKAVFERLEEVKPADSLQWVEPVIGLFHLQMNILKMLMTSHWGNGKEPASLNRFVMALGRNKSGGVDESVKNFRASDRFFNDVLDGQIISKVMSKLNVESETELVERMCFDGEGGKIPVEERDLVYENGLLFLQHGMSYREYAHAISCGDTGRVGCVLEVWTTLLQGSGKAVNYPAEVLHLMACLKRLWSPGLKSIWMRYCLVNPSGKAGGWMPDDLFCEYVIRENKAKFKASTNSSTDGFLREKVARQIISFRDAKQMMYRTTEATNYYTMSRIVQSVADIGKVVVALVQEKVHERQPVRYRRVGEDMYREVPDLFADGTTMLMTGKPIATYLSRARANWGKLSFLEKGEEEEGGPGLDDEDSDDDDDELEIYVICAEQMQRDKT
ncbi:hypothetical protein DFH27DRAFT_616856 [Peziza echinospora]|nr:hypothetical protein DFH27DRAFT_616856 [Peziza echinospora]